MSSLRKVAAIQFLGQFDSNNYYKIEDLFKNIECINKYQTVLKILIDLNLVSSISFNNITYYKIIHTKRGPLNENPKSFSVDSEVFKFKKTHLTNWESLLRQAKLLQNIRSSGEEDKLIDLIDKWENVTREIIKALYEHQKTGNSLKTFVKKLGLNWEDLGFSSESEDEDLEESECEIMEGEHGNYNENYNENESDFYNRSDNKRIKYEE